MLSFHGETCLKDAVVARVKEHQRLDQIVQGVYWDGIKGCGIGCILHSDDHMAVERQLGLPVFWAYMNEHIFESLPRGEHLTWPLRIVEATPVGIDLELVFPRFMHWMLTDSEGIIKHADARTRPIITDLACMYARRIAGIPFDIGAAWSAESANIHRQADYLISLLQSYESKPLNTMPCPEKIRELLPAWKE